MNNNNKLVEILTFFEYDTETLEFINSDASITKDDDSFHSDYYYGVDDDLDDLESVTFWDMSKMTDLESLFQANEEFNELLLWNTKNVVTYISIYSPTLAT